MDIKKSNTNFSVEQLLTGDLAKQKFKVDFLPLWRFLDNMERKVGGFQNVEMKEIFESIYEYAIISVGLDKSDMQVRIDNLNEQNQKWYMKAETLQAEVELLKTKLLESQSTNISL